MLSDYLSRQVMNAIFPYLKADWNLSDTQLGSLVSVVALVVGLFTFPISLIADRVGRVRSATAMAVVWGLATIACGLAGNFTAMFIARALVGLGEAGYGSAGGAILTSVFPRRLHGTVMGAFLAASLFGSVLGVVLGGVLAKHIGWSMTFIVVGAGGLVLAGVFPFAVKEPPSHRAEGEAPMPFRRVVYELFRFRTVWLTYLGSGFQMFLLGTIMAWSPSYLNRYYALDPADAAVRAGLLVLISGIGMTLGGVLADRLSTVRPENRLRVSGAYALSSGGILLVAFLLPPGPLQFALIGFGLLCGSGFAGPAGAVVGEITHASIRATVFATLTLANNLLGLAPGPFITGLIADSAGLDVALRIIPAMSLVAGGCFFLAARHYASDRPIYHRPEKSSLEALESEEATPAR
jgi:MFS family permease